MNLSDEMLLESYSIALRLNLDADFIEYLSVEIRRRKLSVIPEPLKLNPNEERNTARESQATP